MSEFLVLKSTEEQKEEGVDEPVDTAFIEDRDGMPILKASFDVHHFKPDEVTSRFYDYLSIYRLLYPVVSVAMQSCVSESSSVSTLSLSFPLTHHTRRPYCILLKNSHLFWRVVFYRAMHVVQSAVLLS